MKGNFVISLDFELHWGGAEIWDLNNKQTYFLNTRKLIEPLLDLFNQNNIRATWATVGFLFASDLNEIQSYFPLEKPNYLNKTLNYYKLFDKNIVGRNESEDPFHFAASLLKLIKETKGQEIASHTFCHYYCNEPGQSINEFNDDLKASQSISQNTLGKKLTSLVFPRNQYNEDYLEIVSKNEFSVIRTNPSVWFWKANSKYIFLARALDTLFPISQKLSFSNNEISKYKNVILLPASRFFRPYNQKERYIQHLKMYRIKREMTIAAKKGENYHLWWHPHNFGEFPEQNMNQLKEIIQHFKKLNTQYGFMSKNMGDFNLLNL